MFDALADKELWVVSGTAENELQENLLHHGLAHYFSGIYGSPRSKEQIIEDLSLSPKQKSRALYIGDSLYDLRAARASSVDFLFMKNYSEAHEHKAILQQESVHVIGDLRDLFVEGHDVR